MSEVPSVPSAQPQATQAPAQPQGESAPQESIEASGEEQSGQEGSPKEQKAIEKKVEALKKKYNLKVNGKEKSVELDINDDNAVQQYLQKAMASDEKFQEAASLRKNVEMLVKTLKENPMAILTHPDIGIDVKKLAEQVINQELEDMQKSPEQKRLEQLEKQLKEKEDAMQKIEEEKRQAEYARRQEESFRQIDEDITAALKSSELPKVPYVVKRISDTMIAAFDMGYHDVTVKDIMPIVEKQLQEEFGGLFDNSKEEMIEKLLGKNLDRVRKKRLAAKKTPPASPAKDTGAAQTAAKAKQESAEPKKQRFEDLFGKF